MATVQVNPPATGKEPELNLLISDAGFEEPLWKSLSRGLDDFFFPKKLPPLKLESKPEPVKDIWSSPNNLIYAIVTSFAGQCLLGVIIVSLLVVIAHRVVASPAQKVTVTLIDPSDVPILKPGKTQVGGGGGGGDRDVLQASKGKLPKLSMQQITPPVVVVRNEHPKLAVDPTIVVPPQVQLATNNMPNLGDPMAHALLPSNGTGGGGGIGSGSGGGIGSGKGPGYGPGEGGGVGGGIFRVGNGVSPPIALNHPETEFSDEARKAKFQGTCTVGMVVGVDGIPRDIKVLNSLGMGLDEKAMEVAAKYRFKPAEKDGHPVAVQIAIEVDFRMY